MKGHTNNPNGRPKGKPNQITFDLREGLADFLEKHWPQVDKDLKDVSPAERLRFFEKLLPYVIPKLQTIEYRSEGEKLISALTDEQVDQLHALITQRQNEID